MPRAKTLTSKDRLPYSKKQEQPVDLQRRCQTFCTEFEYVFLIDEHGRMVSNDAPSSYTRIRTWYSRYKDIIHMTKPLDSAKDTNFWFCDSEKKVLDCFLVAFHAYLKIHQYLF